MAEVAVSQWFALGSAECVNGALGRRLSRHDELVEGGWGGGGAKWLRNRTVVHNNRLLPHVALMTGQTTKISLLATHPVPLVGYNDLKFKEVTMKRYRRRAKNSTIPECCDLVRLWLLRLLVPMGAHRQFIGHHDFGDDNLAEFLGLGKWIDAEEFDFDQRVLLASLRKLHRMAEHDLCRATPPPILSENIARLSTLVGLSDTDCRILEFTVFIHIEPMLNDTADWLGDLSSEKMYHALATVLDLPEKEIRVSLSAHGVLANSGLVKVGRFGTSSLSSKLDLLSDGFADCILTSDVDPVSLLRDIVIPSKPPQLTINDFSHIDRSLVVLRPYLRQALATRQPGVNVFLHGEPGTGKSELARVLAKEMDCELFEVSCEDEDGIPVNGERRLRAFQAGQSFFAHQQALILFDEVEDVFSDGNSLFGFKSTGQARKGWINRMLEENPVPTLWVSNSAACLDRAFIRRFDMVIALPVPPKRQREQIVRKACDGMLSEESVRRIAEVEELAPAVIARAVAVVRSIRDRLDENDLSGAVEHLVGNTLEAQGYRGLKGNNRACLPETYDPAFIHADADLFAVAEGLVATKSGRLCLYGPPGTGKSAFGLWLAEQLGVPLCLKRASDLISPFLGVTERNIAAAFRQAEQEASLLLIDEVDSFLQDRRKAQRSWEVTEVNEMLTQMEGFSGVFIASTNLMTGLDQAALRRFDLKVKFDFLTTEQAWSLLERHCRVLALPPPTLKVKTRLARLAFLTPGDFATVVRQNRFRPIATPTAFITALEQECVVKEEGQTKAIGFL